ncbi:uncharacterized protein LOC113464509 [Ceratina calcarata]|uniref:Uncharacterized protein LOC113464509 n=1 Tax=Ceratina calcarata TaxID=156304 RepID=A0AAJ7S341_9HYME|nr:uncharacterized protein LOC113464509 [Ceratina calcarata]
MQQCTRVIGKEIMLRTETFERQCMEDSQYTFPRRILSQESTGEWSIYGHSGSSVECCSTSSISTTLVPQRDLRVGATDSCRLADSKRYCYRKFHDLFAQEAILRDHKSWDGNSCHDATQEQC